MAGVVVVVKALVVVAIALIASKTVVVFISMVGATKTAVADETVTMNMEAIALVVTKTLVVVVVVVVVAKTLLVAGVFVAIALLLPMMIMHLVVESMALLTAVAMLMVVSLDPGLTSSGTGSGCWGHASLLEHLRRVIFVLVVVRAHADGDMFLDLRLNLNQSLGQGLRLGLCLGWGVNLDRGMNRSLSLRARKWQRGVALFTAGTVMDWSQGLGHGFIFRDRGTALTTTGAVLSKGARVNLQETGGLGTDPWLLCPCLGSLCWCGCGDSSNYGLRTLLWQGRLLGSFDVIHPLAVDVDSLAEI